MKSLTICYLVNRFPSISETFIMNQITDIIDRGHEVKIFAIRKSKGGPVHDDFIRYRLAEKVTYFEPFRSHGTIARMLRFALFGIRNLSTLVSRRGIGILALSGTKREMLKLLLDITLIKFLKANRFDVVHAHFGQQGKLVADLMASKKVGGFRLITSFHGYDVNPLFIETYKKSYRNLFREADVLTANSKYLADLVMSIGDCKSKLTLMPEGFRSEKFRRLASAKRDGNKIVIIFCGRLVPFKAPDLAIRIMDSLVNGRGIRNVSLRLIGEGPMRQTVESLIKEKKLHEHVVMLGSQNQDQVRSEMQDADLFLLPGIHERDSGRAETQGLVIQEAQAMELPVVVSDAGGAKYGVLDNVSGFVVREGEVQSFAERIQHLIEIRGEREKMGKAGREFVSQTFDSRILGNKLVDIYDQLVKV